MMTTKIARMRSEETVAQELGTELNRQDRPPQADKCLRLTGEFNRLRGSRVKLEVLSAMKKKGFKDVNALLDRNG